MKQLVRYLVSGFILWLLLFNLHRLLFLAAFARTDNGWFGSFQHSLTLDLSAAAYLGLVPLLVGFINLFAGAMAQKRISTFLKAYFFIALTLVCLIQAGDMAVYREWQIKLPFKALMHLAHPLEPILTASPLYLFAFIGTFALEFLAGWLLYRLLIKNIDRQNTHEPVIIRIAGFTVLSAISFFMIRGGFGQFPASISWAYYSDHSVLNDAAVNSPWQFVADILANTSEDDARLYHFYADDEAQKTVEQFYKNTGDTPSVNILKTDRPNIVMIILESWSAECVGALGEFKGLTPGFDSLANEGVLFTNFYANSWMSEKGNAAILSGCPILPTTSIAERSSAYRKFPALNQPLQNNHYQTSYYYGGYLYFANIRSYLLDHGFQTVTDRESLNGKLPMGQLGVHDGNMLPFFGTQLSLQSQPFFSVLFTLSTHSPYDIPAQYLSGKPGEQQPYMDAIKYADASLSAFFAEAKKQPWYNNTLFVLVSDHSHPTPHYRDGWDKDRYRIPLLLVGPVIKDSCRGMKVNKLASQMDIAATLLCQLGLERKEFIWSKDAINNASPEFAPYSFNDGCGWIEPTGYVAWNVSTKQFMGENKTQQENSPLAKRARSFYQMAWKWLAE